jgi:hypothetical protein
LNEEKMKKISLWVLCLGMSSLVTFAQPVRKVVFVIADGIPADVIESVPTPHLDSISQKGRYMRAHVGGDKGTYTETPTISAVGYNSLLTGTWVNKHNVWDNDIKDPNYHYPTIFRLLKDGYPQKKIAVFSSWQDNRTKLVGEGLPETGNIRLDQYADGYDLDTVNFPHDRRRDFMHRIDEHIVDEAVKSIRQTAPDLSWVYLEYTDDMGHMFGDSPEMKTAVGMVDQQMGRLWDAIQYRQKKFHEEWLIIITTDHGRTETNGRGHGGQSPRQRGTWMITNYPNINTYPDYYQPGIVDIFPTITRYMNIHVPLAVDREIDGIPMIGKVSLADMTVNYIQGKLDISWTALDPKENSSLKVWVSATNHVKTGGTDDYRLVGEVPLNRKHIDVSVKDNPSSFYKVVLEGRNNSLNRWVILPDAKKSVSDASKGN